MFLTDEEKRMLAGDHSPGIQRAMDLLVKLGDSFDAEKLVPITYGHILDRLDRGRFGKSWKVFSTMETRDFPSLDYPSKKRRG